MLMGVHKSLKMAFVGYDSYPPIRTGICNRPSDSAQSFALKIQEALRTPLHHRASFHASGTLTFRK